MKNKVRTRTLIVLSLLTIAFVALVIYLNIFLFSKGENYRKLSYNRRLMNVEEKVRRGSITDRNGLVLAESVPIEKGFKRIYKFPMTYSHIIGYMNYEYGKAGLEQSFNNELIGLSGTSADEIKQLAGVERGNDLRLSVDHELEVYARECLKNRKGAILSMDLENGDLLCMASYPDFNSEKIAEEWKLLLERNDAPLFNRATQGLYPPGSIFKIVTTAALLPNIGSAEIYNSTGEEKIDGNIIHDSNRDGFGEIDLLKAFAFSSNTYYAKMSLRLSDEDWKRAINDFRLNKACDFDIPAKAPKVDFQNLSDYDKALSAIGQGKILVTPLSMLEMVSIVANKGVYIKPRLVNALISPSGNVDKIPVYKSKIGSEENFVHIGDMMREVVHSGTGKNARIEGIDVCGKTGTAENATGKSHAWFVGFAPYDNPKVAVCVLLESEGSTGGLSAAPIARNILQKSIKIKEE